MAYYILTSCISKDTYVVDFGTNTVNIGEIWSFKSPIPGSQLLCGEVLEETDITPLYDSYSLYSDCCRCYLDNNYQSFKFLDCDGITEYYVSITTFCVGFGSTPIVEGYYKFYTDPAICAQFVDVSTNDPDTNMTPSTGQFEDCLSCNNKWEAIDCVTEEIYNLDFSFNFNVNPGEVYSLMVDENIKCVSLENLVDSPTGITVNEYLITCVECYIANGFQSLKFINCVDSSVYIVDLLTFYNTYSFIPTSNSVYELYVTKNNQFINNCFTFTEVVTDVFDSTVDTIVLEYGDCITCTSPKSANTESTVCVICSGNTFTVSPPHPVWTDNQGKAVIQLDAITLGGNGLNS